MARKQPKIVSEIYRDILNTITALRTENLLRDESGVSIKPLSQNTWSISYSTKNDSGSIVYDKNISFACLADNLLQNRQYTILLYDKSIVQVEFMIRDNEIIKERLVFMKKHNVIWNPDEINELEANDEHWFDVETGIPIVFRIDYDPSPGVFKEIDHPKTHFTLSNHESCRIPIRGIVTFSEFMRFVLKHYYEKDIDVGQYRLEEETITENEKKWIHINWK